MFFINKYYNICQNSIKKPLGGPQKMPSTLCNVGKIQLKTYVKCVYALINQLISITNNECLILHHKAFCTDYNSCNTKIGAPSIALILVLCEF